MLRLLGRLLLVGAVLGGLVGGALLVVLPTTSEAPAPLSVEGIDGSQPVVVVVRGWLWDPASRDQDGPLEWFPAQVNEGLGDRIGLSASFVQFDWSRVPTELVAAAADFRAWATAISEAGLDSGRCVSFVGHSAGAAMVYDAAATGTRMGYMGTLGLPTAGSRKPEGVDVWANFYTTSHIDDVAGRLWGPSMGADVNIDLHRTHKEFWGDERVVAESVDAIVSVWNSCP